MKRRKRRKTEPQAKACGPELARDGYPPRVGPRKRTLEYVEEAEGYPLAGHATLAGRMIS